MRIDYAFGNDMDLIFENGDFKKVSSDYQHVMLIASTNVGEWRQFPLTGFGAVRYVKSREFAKTKFVGELREQLEADGYVVNSIDVSSREWWSNFGIDVI